MGEPITRATLVLLVTTLIFAPSAAQAGIKLFQGAWAVEAFGNELTGGAKGEESEFYSRWVIPLGVQCNQNQPRCPFRSTPTNGTGSFARLGGSQVQALFCTPWANWQGGSTATRPAKGGTSFDSQMRPIPPLYRNYAFFTASTPSAQPDTYSCRATTTDGFGGPGVVMLGSPITGTWDANTIGGALGGFTFSAAPASGGGIRTSGQLGSFAPYRPFAGVASVSLYYTAVYKYTYATLRNDRGIFGIGDGPGSFSLSYTMGKLKSVVDGKGDAQIFVKAGTAKFGGTMRMLGALTTKGCNFASYTGTQCWGGENNWRYDAVGALAYYDNSTVNGGATPNAVVISGYLATHHAYYYHSVLMTPSTVSVEGARFPWTTGNVTVRATGRGTHKTIHYAQGYDHRVTTTSNGLGTIQLVTPVLTRWHSAGAKFETGGIGILRIKFIPEPHSFEVLLAGVALLGVGYRMRRG